MGVRFPNARLHSVWSRSVGRVVLWRRRQCRAAVCRSRRVHRSARHAVRQLAQRRLDGGGDRDIARVAELPSIGILTQRKIVKIIYVFLYFYLGLCINFRLNNRSRPVSFDLCFTRLCRRESLEAARRRQATTCTLMPSWDRWTKPSSSRRPRAIARPHC